MCTHRQPRHGVVAGCNKVAPLGVLVLRTTAAMHACCACACLQALHALLEPGYPAQLPDVAVVGISNWALDAAKMSRAVLLAR